MASTHGSSSTDPVKWGFVSTAMIAAKNEEAVKNAANAELVGVSSRSLDKAKQWIDGVGLTGKAKAFGDYKEMLKDGNIDAVYVPVPTGARKDVLIEAAKHKKHILSEKPPAVSADDLKEVLKACKENGVQYMDGVMFMHHTRRDEMKKSIEEHGLGPVKYVDSDFSVLQDPSFFEGNIRVKSDLEPLGALGDLGYYNIRQTLESFNYEWPTSVSAFEMQANSAGVPLDVVGHLFFQNGRSASFHCSFVNTFRQDANIVCEKGIVSLDDFVIARTHESCEYTIRKNGSLTGKGQGATHEAITKEIRNCNQEKEMIVNFGKQVASGGIDEQWPNYALQTQTVMDACVMSMKQDGKRVTVTPALYKDL
eukprot:gb/GECG01004850.1/.p1 GENE.gb/GECG01004850.1/~~gb/GECG01004850.1/.p1  ORF type:complete len:366 (+),score=53.44 gb/GECG01004850.1/:1-1098(+)